MGLLVEHGAEPNLTPQNHATALMVAAGLNRRDIASLGTEDESLEVLQFRLDRGADSLIRFRVSRGADLNARTARGRTALDEALGQAVMADVDDARRPERKSTVALLRELMGTQTNTTAPVQ